MSACKRAVVLGGNGLIGSKVVSRFRSENIEVVSASKSSGVDTFTGKGVFAALKDADVVVDASDALSLDPADVRKFFDASCRNIFTAEVAAGVKHHVTLSIVGAGRLVGNAHFEAKRRQEEETAKSGVPYTIVRATQLYELIPSLASAFTEHGDVTRVPDVLIQPIAAHDVAAALFEAALGDPRNAILEVGGPERAPFGSLARKFFNFTRERRTVQPDLALDYFGAEVEEHSLVPSDPYLTGMTTLGEWFGQLHTSTIA